MVGRGGVTMERTLQRGVLVWRHQALSLTHCIPKEETSCCLIWLVSWEEFLLCGELGGAGACMRMVGSFTVRRSPAPGHGCILQSPLGRNLKHDLRCTSTNDTRHHPTPTLYLHTFLFFYSHWRFWPTGQQQNSRKQQGGHTFTWFRHFANIWKCFYCKVMFRNTFVLPQDLYIHFTLDIINCDLRHFPKWGIIDIHRKCHILYKQAKLLFKTSQQRSLGSDRVKMKIIILKLTSAFVLENLIKSRPTNKFVQCYLLSRRKIRSVTFSDHFCHFWFVVFVQLYLYERIIMNCLR